MKILNKRGERGHICFRLQVTEKQSVLKLLILTEHLTGNVSNAVNDVLEKWKSDYSNLLNQQPSSQVHSDVINQLVDQSGNAVTVNDFLPTEEISVEEECNDVNTVKKSKASGVDNITADVF
jgi:hypothetical protein